MTTASKRDEALPDHVRGLPAEVQIAVLYERVGNLAADVRGLKQVIIGGIATVLGGLGLTAVSVAAGWLGPGARAAGVAVVGWLL